MTGTAIPFVIEQHNATGSVSYWQRGDNQSVADCCGVSLAEYIHAIYGFLRQAKCGRVLMIGCGGGTLATMLHRVGVCVTIVDIDPTSFAIARRYFHMPDGIGCHVADGRAFLRRHEARYDAIVLDAYSKTKVPKHLLSASFFALVKARLHARKSLFLINLIVADDDDRRPDRITRRMNQVWRQVRLFDRDGWEDRNAIAMAGSVRTLTRPRILLRPKSRARRLANRLGSMHFRALRG